MTRPIRLVFDAHAITPERSGIGDYSYNLFKAFLEFFPDEVDLSLFATDRIARVRMMDDVAEATRGVAPGSLYSLHNQRVLPSLLRKGAYDLLHTPDYAIPLLNRRVPVVATIHDIVPVVYPELLNKSKKVKLLRLFKWYIRQALSRSIAVITVSEFSKREILRCFNADEKKIFPIHCANYLTPVEDFTEGDVIPGAPAGKYFLFVGRQEPYKGIAQLLEAYAAVRDQITPVVTKLVFAGKVDGRYPWTKMSRNLGLENDILFTGYITERQLSWAYRNAAALVFPSLYEGFGLPPLDAMAHGIPVAASNRASIPEVAGEAALLFDPENALSFRETLVSLALNSTLRNELIAKGRLRVREFSWERTAKKTVEVYRKVLSR